MPRAWGAYMMTIVRGRHSASVPILPLWCSFHIHPGGSKSGMKGLPASQLQDFKATLKKSWFLILPIRGTGCTTGGAQAVTNKGGADCRLSLASWFSRRTG